MHKETNKIYDLEGHAQHWEFLATAKVTVSDGCLMFNQFPVMFDFEAPLFELGLSQVDGLSSADFRVLDIGTGMGVFLGVFLKRSSGKYWGCEINGYALDLLTNLYAHEIDVGRINFLHHAWQLADFSSQSFHLISYDTWPPEGESNNDFLKFLDKCSSGLLNCGGTLLAVSIGDKPNSKRMHAMSKVFAHIEVFSIVAPKEVKHWFHSSRQVNLLVGIKFQKSKLVATD
jgi:SAM-dependent methyltransferase